MLCAHIVTLAQILLFVLLTIATVDFRLVQEPRKHFRLSHSVLQELLWGREESHETFTVLNGVVGVS